MEAIDNLLQIEDRERAERLLQEWGQLERRQVDLDAERDEAIARINRQFAEKATIERDGQRTTISDRIDLLKTSLHAWAIQHRDLLLTSKLKSVELTHGKLAWRVIPQRIDPIENEVSGKLREEILAEATKHVTAALRARKPFPRCPIDSARVLSVKLAFAVKGIGDAVAKGDLSLRELSRLGHCLTEPRESLNITLNPGRG